MRTALAPVFVSRPSDTQGRSDVYRSPEQERADVTATAHSATEAAAPVVMMPIGDITVGARYRNGLGPLRDLQHSIRDTGLLRPLPVTADGVLIVGARRLAACRNLGWTEVPVIVAHDGTDAIRLLRDDQRDTLCAKPMTASELVALGLQVEEYERPNAAHRKALSAGHNKLPEEMRYQTRDVAADAVGLSVGQYALIRTVVLAASGIEVCSGGFERIPVDEALQAEAREALTLIDRIHAGEEIRVPGRRLRLSINGVCRAWTDRRAKARIKDQSNVDWSTPGVPEATEATPVDQPRMVVRNLPRLDQHKALMSGLHALAGLCHGLAGIEVIDPAVTAEEAASIERDLAQATRTLRVLHNKIKEYRHGIA